MSDHAVEAQDERLDQTGHCIDHPQIRVRRPNSNGSWRTILTNGCPLCAIDPVKPYTRRDSNGSNSGALTRRDSGSRRWSHCQDENDFTKSYCSSSDVTATTVASSQSSSSCHSTLDDFQGPISPTSSSRSKRIVCGMPYVDPVSGRSGTYTGQISQESQLPNGVGCLRLHDGDVMDGEWCRGRMVDSANSSRRSEYARHASRSKRESLAESLNRSCRLEDEYQSPQQSFIRQPSRSRREALSRSIRMEEDPQPQHHDVRTPSRSRRESMRSLSRSCRFYEEDEDANSIGDNNSLGSHGEQTVATYSARESKSSLPKRSGGIDRRPSRSSYSEVKH